MAALCCWPLKTLPNFSQLLWHFWKTASAEAVAQPAGGGLAAATGRRLQFWGVMHRTIRIIRLVDMQLVLIYRR